MKRKFYFFFLAIATIMTLSAFTDVTESTEVKCRSTDNKDDYCYRDGQWRYYCVNTTAEASCKFY